MEIRHRDHRRANSACPITAVTDAAFRRPRPGGARPHRLHHRRSRRAVTAGARARRRPRHMEPHAGRTRRHPHRDRPGPARHGESDAPADDYSLGALAAALRDVLVILGLPSATIVGHSLGGGVALQFADQFPECTDRLVLVSNGGLGSQFTPMLGATTLPGAQMVVAGLARRCRPLSAGDRRRSSAARGAPPFGLHDTASIHRSPLAATPRIRHGGCHRRSGAAAETAERGMKRGRCVTT